MTLFLSTKIRFFSNFIFSGQKFDEILFDKCLTFIQTNLKYITSSKKILKHQKILENIAVYIGKMYKREERRES